MSLKTLCTLKYQGIDVSAQAVSFVLDYDKTQRKAKERENLSLMILPQFTVFNLTKAEPILAEFVKRTRNEKGCLYYGWSLSGDQLICEEIYVDAASIKIHLENIGPLIAELTADGVAKLESIALHGPSGEVDKLRE